MADSLSKQMNDLADAMGEKVKTLEAKQPAIAEATLVVSSSYIDAIERLKARSLAEFNKRATSHVKRSTHSIR